ncbi:MAG: allantoin permease, partial [Mobilicoccus sp.]|nr:allantoin permease [Mobilicoccus sp.]
TWITGGITIIYVALTVGHIDWAVVAGLPHGSVGAVVGALTMVMTGFGLGWINIAADWSRYQHRDASNAAIIGWNTLGGAVAPVVLVLYGLLLAGSDPDLQAGIELDPIGTLATILPIWVLIPFWITAVLALVSGAVLGIYSSGLTLLSLGIRIPRPAAAAIDGIILTIGTIWVVFFAESFLGPFQSFLLILGVPMASWAGILIADILSRRRPYDELALFDARGRYRAFDWVSIATMVGATAIGWGLVINMFAGDAAWANWQGYLLEPLGLGTRSIVDGVEQWDGVWPWANLGVLFALVGSFAVTFIARQPMVARQEERA